MTMDRIIALQTQMLAAYAEWGRAPSAEGYHQYWTLRLELLRLLHIPQSGDL